MNWHVIQSLHRIFLTNSTPKTISLLQDDHIKYLIHSTKELKETKKVIIGQRTFKEMYEKHHLSSYLLYSQFFDENDWITPYPQLQEVDIKTLMELKRLMEADELTFLRQQLLEANESRRGLSQMFFKNDKYLDNREALVDAIKRLLDIDVLVDDKDQQYMYILHVGKPKAIVLCENLYNLKIPSWAIKNQIELWYAGGNNIEKLDRIPEIKVPIYYSCDWDYHGLTIYSRVYEKIPGIKLLSPIAEPKKIDNTEHRSLWNKSENLDKLSGLNKSLFTIEQIDLIQHLIKANSWIIEESNNLINVLKFNNCI